MLTIEILTPFIIASSLLALAPGPDNLFVLTQSAANGRRAGLMITLGLCSGLIIHSLMVALGLAVVFKVSTVAFVSLKVLGAAYLIYLARQCFRANADAIEQAQNEYFSNWAYYRRGIILNLSNPKVTIFFLAFLPQFINSEAGSVQLQVFILGAIFMLITLIVFGSFAFVAGGLHQLLAKNPQNQLYLNKLAGCVFFLLAAKLLWP